MEVVLIASNNKKDPSQAIQVARVELSICTTVDDKDKFVDCILENFDKEVLVDLKPKDRAKLRNYKYIGFLLPDGSVIFPIYNPLQEEEEEEVDVELCKAKIAEYRQSLLSCRERVKELRLKISELEEEVEFWRAKYETLSKKVKSLIQQTEKSPAGAQIITSLIQQFVELKKSELEVQKVEKEIELKKKVYEKFGEEETGLKRVKESIDVAKDTAKSLIELLTMISSPKQPKEERKGEDVEL